jgi:hypothetical protein
MRSGRPLEGRAIGAGTSSITAFTAPLNTLPHDSTLSRQGRRGTGSDPGSGRPIGYGTWLGVCLSLSVRVYSGPLQESRRGCRPACCVRPKWSWRTLGYEIGFVFQGCPAGWSRRGIPHLSGVSWHGCWPSPGRPVLPLPHGKEDGHLDGWRHRPRRTSALARQKRGAVPRLQGHATEPLPDEERPHPVHDAHWQEDLAASSLRLRLGT